MRPVAHRAHLTGEEKLKILALEWGYVEMVSVTHKPSGETKYLVKNYKGKLPQHWKRGDPLPGNPTTGEKKERTGFTPYHAITMAYWKLKMDMRRNVARSDLTRKRGVA